MSKAVRKYSISQLVSDGSIGSLRVALEAAGVMIDELIDAVNSLSIGSVTDAKRVGQIDGVWLVAVFAAAATSQTFTHNLGRMPVGFIEAKGLPGTGESILNGEVILVTATETTITMQCETSGKTARLILF